MKTWRITLKKRAPEIVTVEADALLHAPTGNLVFVRRDDNAAGNCEGTFCPPAGFTITHVQGAGTYWHCAVAAEWSPARH